MKAFNVRLAVAESDSWRLRHPVGRDAEPMLARRAGWSDKEWVDRAAMGDDEWYDSLKRAPGPNIRPQAAEPSGFGGLVAWRSGWL